MNMCAKSLLTIALLLTSLTNGVAAETKKITVQAQADTKAAARAAAKKKFMDEVEPVCDRCFPKIKVTKHGRKWLARATGRTK
jgi:hypothetical protein